MSRLAWSLYICVTLWRAVYGPSTTERPNGTICEKRDFLPVSGFLSLRYMT